MKAFLKAIGVVAFLAVAGHAAIVLDSTGSVHAGSGVSSVTYSFTVGSGSNQLLVVSNAYGSNQTVNSVTYNGTSMTEQIKENTLTSAGVARTDICTLTAPSTGANNVVVTFSGNTTYYSQATSWFGVSQSAPVGSGAKANNSGSVTSISTSVASNVGDVVIDNMSEADTTGGLAPGASQSTLFISNDQNFGYNSAGSQKAGVATTTPMSWSWSFGGFTSMVGIALKTAPAITPSQLTCGSQCPTCTSGFSR